jgi:hypothetical protein
LQPKESEVILGESFRTIGLLKCKCRCHLLGARSRCRDNRFRVKKKYRRRPRKSEQEWGPLQGIAPQSDERPLRGSSNEDPGGDAAVLALDGASVSASQFCAQHSIGVYPFLRNVF